MILLLSGNIHLVIDMDMTMANPSHGRLWLLWHLNISHALPLLSDTQNCSSGRGLFKRKTVSNIRIFMSLGLRNFLPVIAIAIVFLHGLAMAD